MMTIRAWTPGSRIKILLLVGTTAATIAFHYGWLTRIFGDTHWVHAIHGRLCYIPIVVAAAWFGVRGGLITASAITALVLPYVFRSVDNPHNLASESAEIVFYFAIAILSGVLVEREFAARRKQQEAELHAERTHKLSLVGQIAAGVAHEVKNPLASIKGAADILTSEKTAPADREEFRQILRNEIKRIDGTVAEFLEFARPKRMHTERLNFTKTLLSTLRQIDAQASSKHVKIESSLDENVTIDGDAEKLRQMVLNLLLNAIEASNKDGVIGVKLVDLDGHGGRLEISDSGIGIKQEDIERVFEPFYTTRPSGTGLGLAIVKEIIDSHGATVAISSETNRGTSVIVTFPGVNGR